MHHWYGRIKEGCIHHGVWGDRWWNGENLAPAWIMKTLSSLPWCVWSESHCWDIFIATSRTCSSWKSRHCSHLLYIKTFYPEITLTEESQHNCSTFLFFSSVFSQTYEMSLPEEHKLPLLHPSSQRPPDSRNFGTFLYRKMAFILQSLYECSSCICSLVWFLMVSLQTREIALSVVLLSCILDFFFSRFW